MFELVKPRGGLDERHIGVSAQVLVARGESGDEARGVRGLVGLR
jgi:hypothetical protein